MKSTRKLKSSIAAVFNTVLLFSPVFAGDYAPTAKQVQYPSTVVDTGFYFIRRIPL